MNKSNRVSLDVVNIASPCAVAWNEMPGDDRVRFCGQCQLNVYNVSELSRAEAEAFVSQREGRTCIRIYRREDGTILIRDCPIGLRAVRRRLARMVAAIAAVLSGLVVSTLFGRSPQASVGNVLRAGPLARFAAWLEPPIYPLMGDMVIPTALDGAATEDGLTGNSDDLFRDVTAQPSGSNGAVSAP